VISERVTEFAGKAVQDWDEETGITDPAKVHYRIWCDYDDEQLWTDKLAAFLDDPKASQVTGLIVGNWGQVASGEDPVTDVAEALTVARDRLPNLTALFLGDISQEESEISWIVQADISPLFRAYPRLEYLRIRGGQGLRFGALQHDHLKSLIVETGGLPVVALRDILKARLPALEHLELWLGEDSYGWDGSLDDLRPLFESTLFPNLRYLGLRNSEIADEIAAAIANAPVLQCLHTLDLSLGTLSDEGATALLNSPYVPHLEKLDCHHHFLSEEMVTRLMNIPRTHMGDYLNLDASDRQKEEGYGRYVAIGE
jgi:hypothetical protein